MPTLFIYLAVAGGGLVILKYTIRLIDAWVSRSIGRHVHAALDLAPEEMAFEAHVSQAMDVAATIPQQRTHADQAQGADHS